MMQLRIAASATLLVALSICAVFGQSNLPAPPYAIITYSDGSSVVAPGAGATFPLVGLLPNQPVQVTVQYPPYSGPGQPIPTSAIGVIIAHALDGGALFPPAGTAPLPLQSGCVSPTGCNVLAVVPDPSGKLNFAFVPGSLPGGYRVALRQGSRAMLLEFWVQDPNNAQNNPPVITPATPDNY